MYQTRRVRRCHQSSQEWKERWIHTGSFTSHGAHKHEVQIECSTTKWLGTIFCRKWTVWPNRSVRRHGPATNSIKLFWRRNFAIIAVRKSNSWVKRVPWSRWLFHVYMTNGNVQGRSIYSCITNQMLQRFPLPNWPCCKDVTKGNKPFSRQKTA